MSTKEKYRFENGSLYVYDEKAGAYIHCWKNAFDNTKAKAVRAYEEYLTNEWCRHILPDRQIRRQGKEY